MPLFRRAPLAFALAFTASCAVPPALPPETPAEPAPPPAAAEPAPAPGGRIVTEHSHGGLGSLAVDAAGHVRLLESDKGGFSVRDVQSGHQLQRFSALNWRISVQLSPDGQSLYSVREPLTPEPPGAGRRLPLLLEKWSLMSGERVAQADVGALLGEAAGGYRVTSVIAGPKPKGKVLFRIASQDMGVLLDADGSLWTVEGDPKNYQTRILRRYDKDGHRIAEHALPPTLETGMSVQMGWVKTGKQLWYRKGIMHCRLHLVTLPVEGRAAPAVEDRVVCGEGTVMPLPGERFVVEYQHENGIGLFRSDGTLLLTVGSIDGDGFAFAPDGKFACNGRGCEALRCAFNGESFDAGHESCRHLRVAGFDPEALWAP